MKVESSSPFAIGFARGGQCFCIWPFAELCGETLTAVVLWQATFNITTLISILLTLIEAPARAVNAITISWMRGNE